jgi:putative DNA primase/helicase
VRHARAAAAAVGGKLVVPKFQRPGPGDTDFNDLHQARGLDAVREQIAEATFPNGSAADTLDDGSTPETLVEQVLGGASCAGTATEEGQRTEDSLDATVARLAKLKPLEYEQIREKEAKRLRVRVGVLDKEVAKARPSDEGSKGEELSFEEVLAWADPVVGAAILDEIREAFGRHVVAPSDSLDALTLWALGTWCYDAFPIFPKAFVTSPVKRCGKSVTLEVLETVVCRPLMSSSVSASSIFRTVHEWKPTLIVDEADRLPKDSEELVGIINAGHKKRAAYVIRTEKVGDKFVPVRYSVWSPMALGAIGRMADTIMDRSVVIHLRRKVRGERAEKVPIVLFEQHRELRQRCLRWAEDHVGALRHSNPVLPAHGNDRALDNWTPLFAIAAAAGGDWLKKAAAAFAKLTVEEEDESIGPALLRDIRDVCSALPAGQSSVASKDLVSALVAMEDKPWAEWRKGKAITQHNLARLLHPYKITSGTVRVGASTPKGYRLAQFKDAWDRYLGPIAAAPPFQSATTPHPSNDGACSEKPSATTDADVADEISREPSNDAACGVVADQNGGLAEEGVYVYEF